MKKSVFIVMPFAKAESINGKYPTLNKDNFDTIFEVLQEIFKDLGYNAKRSDSVSNIIREIIIDLDRSELVVADLTGLNPNVMYELGIRHALCKKTILISQDVDEIPFDLKSYFCIQYAWVNNSDRKKLKEDLIKVLQKINSDANQRYGPYHTYAEIKNNAIIEHNEKILEQRLMSLNMELIMYQQVILSIFKKLSKTISAIQEVKSESGINDYKINYKNLNLEDSQKILYSHDFNYSLPSIDMLLGEMYIPIKFNKYGDVDKFINFLRSIKNIQAYSKILDANEIDSGLPLDSLRVFLWKVQILCSKIIVAVKLGLDDECLDKIDKNRLEEIKREHKNVS